MISSLFAAIIRINFFNILSGICELLLERITFPVLVIQIFVAVDLARPSDIWTSTTHDLKVMRFGGVP